MNMHKTILKWALALTAIGLLFPSPLLAQTSAVSGNLQNLGATAITSSNTYVEFTLRNYGSSLPRVSGTAVVVSKNQRFNPDGSGDISGSIYRNDNITPDGTFYRVCVFDNGRRFRCNDYTIAAATFDLSSAAPNTTPPVVTAPTGDTTYQRLDGGNNASGNYVPDTIGLNLGSASAQWDVFANLTAVHSVFVGANGLLSGDPLYCWDTVNTRLGIGTCSPSVELEVVGDGVFDNAADVAMLLKVLSGGTTNAVDICLGHSSTCDWTLSDVAGDAAFLIMDPNGEFRLIFNTLAAGGSSTFRVGANNAAFFFQSSSNEELMMIDDVAGVGVVDISGTLTVDGGIPSYIWLPAAGCNNTIASPFWDLFTSATPAVACITGSQTQKGVFDFDSTADEHAQITLMLPTGWVGAVSATIKWFSSVTTAANVIWGIQTSCVADGETDDPAWNTASTVVDANKTGGANQTNDATIASVTVTGCAAGELLHIRWFRDASAGGDTLNGVDARGIGVELKILKDGS